MSSFFFVEMSFKQWVEDYTDWSDPRLTNARRVLNYLQRYPDESPQNAIIYILKHYQKAFGNDQVRDIIQQRIKKLSEDAAEELYHYLENENPKVLKKQGFIHMLSLGAPILFWKYLNPSGARVHHEHHHRLYLALNNKQRETYAVDAVTLDGYLLQHLTPKQQTDELCLRAVKNDGFALSCVPTKKRSNIIVAAAVSRSASAMEYASKEQRIKFIEIAVMGTGQIWNHHRIGGFSTNDWNRPWANEVFRAIGQARKKELYKRWKTQRDNDANAWHNEQASR
jgi:hypothetical protein